MNLCYVPTLRLVYRFDRLPWARSRIHRLSFFHSSPQFTCGDDCDDIEREMVRIWWTQHVGCRHELFAPDAHVCIASMCVCVLCTVVIIAVLLHQIPSGTPFSCCSVDLWYFFFLVGVCVLARRAVFVRKSRIESPSECALHGTWSPNDRFGYLILSTFLSTTLFAKTYTALHDLISRKGIRLLSKREYTSI